MLVLPGRAARPVAALRPRGWGSGGDARGRAAQAHGVQAYLAGHDHNLEHIHVPGASVHYIISGGGSKSDRGFIGAAHSAFQWPASGFVAARLGHAVLQPPGCAGLTHGPAPRCAFPPGPNPNCTCACTLACALPCQKFRTEQNGSTGSTR